MQKLCIKCVQRDILSFNEPKSIMVWKQKDEFFTSLAMNIFILKYRRFMLCKSYVGINEIMVYIKKTYAGIKV